MKTLTLTLVAALIAGCGGGGSDDSDLAFAVTKPEASVNVAPPVVVNTKACRVVIYGDSIAAREWIAIRMMAARPAWVVENRAVPGDTAASGVPRTIGERRDFDVAAVEWGFNDMNALKQMPNALVAQMVEKLKGEGIRPVITGIANVRDWATSLNASMGELAKAHGVPFANWGGVANVVTTDGTHPNEQSTADLVDVLIPVIQKECP